MTQAPHPLTGMNMQTVGVAITAKLNNCSNNTKITSISNKVNNNNKMTNRAYNYNKWDPLQQEC